MSWKTFHRTSEAPVPTDTENRTSTEAALAPEAQGAPTPSESFVDRIKAALAA